MVQQKYLDFVKAILPNTYTVQESKKPGSIHCVSSVGIKKGIDSEDDIYWGFVTGAIKSYFGDEFQEIDHNTCFLHTDFTIYLKPQ